MQSYTNYPKIALILVYSIIITIVAQGGSYRQQVPASDKNEKNNASSIEMAVIKMPKQAKETSTEKATASKKQAAVKATEKPTVKATEKPTEKPTSKLKTEATEKPTSAPTEPATEVPTELVTEFVPDFIVEAPVPIESLADDTYVIPTEPPTEWTQELQDIYDAQYEAGYLYAIDNPDYGYSTGQVVLSEQDRVLACQIVYGEAGGEGFEGCCLVAQCLKDSMVFLGYNSIADVQKYCKYDGWQENYSATAEQAVDYIFNQNKSAVAHRILFFYAPDLCTSSWHETQKYVLTHNTSRFFDMW